MNFMQNIEVYLALLVLLVVVAVWYFAPSPHEPKSLSIARSFAPEVRKAIAAEEKASDKFAETPKEAILRGLSKGSQKVVAAMPGCEFPDGDLLAALARLWRHVLNFRSSVAPMLPPVAPNWYYTVSASLLGVTYYLSYRYWNGKDWSAPVQPGASSLAVGLAAFAVAQDTVKFWLTAPEAIEQGLPIGIILTQHCDNFFNKVQDDANQA